MKKVLVLILACIMLFSCFSSIAEEDVFTMRRGIIFGDTIDTLIEKTGVEFVETDAGYYKTTELENIANIDCVEQHAYFDDNGQLTGMTFISHTYMDGYSDSYEYGGWTGLMSQNPGEGFNNDVYKDLANRLTEKYGKAVNDDTIPLGYAVAETYERIVDYNSIGVSKADLEADFYEWILPNNDGSLVRIECAYIYYCSNTTKPIKCYWDLIWGYTLIDASVVDAVNASEKAINDDL